MTPIGVPPTNHSVLPCCTSTDDGPSDSDGSCSFYSRARSHAPASPHLQVASTVCRSPIRRRRLSWRGRIGATVTLISAVCVGQPISYCHCSTGSPFATPVCVLRSDASPEGDKSSSSCGPFALCFVPNSAAPPSKPRAKSVLSTRSTGTWRCVLRLISTMVMRPGGMLFLCCASGQRASSYTGRPRLSIR